MEPERLDNDSATERLNGSTPAAETMDYANPTPMMNADNTIPSPPTSLDAVATPPVVNTSEQVQPVSSLVKRAPGLIAAIVAGVVAVVLIVVLVVVFATGGMGQKDAPTGETAKNVCAEYGGDFSDSTTVYGDHKNEVTGRYVCTAMIDTYEPRFDFALMTMSKDFNEAEFTAFRVESIRLNTNSNSSNYIVVAASDDFVEEIEIQEYSGTTEYTFYAAYKNTVIYLNSYDMKEGVEVLNKLGFPARGL